MADEYIEVLRKKYEGRKILVASPSSGRLDHRFYDSFLDMVQASAPVVSMRKAWAMGSRITSARNGIVDHAQMVRCTDILWIDDDTKFPVNGLIRLLEHDKDIVCATTCSRDGVNKEPIGVALKAAPGSQLMLMERVGMPFMLTKMSVFEKLRKPYFAEPPVWMMNDIIPTYYKEDDVLGEDTYFCMNARAAGFDIWCDGSLSLEIGHIGSNVNYIRQAIPVVASQVDIELGTGPVANDKYLENPILAEQNEQAAHRAVDGVGE